MCRRNLLFGWIALAFGAGLLLGVMVDSALVKWCLGAVCLGVGLALLRKSPA